MEVENNLDLSKNVSINSTKYQFFQDYFVNTNKGLNNQIVNKNYENYCNKSISIVLMTILLEFVRVIFNLNIIKFIQMTIIVIIYSQNIIVLQRIKQSLHRNLYDIRQDLSNVQIINYISLTIGFLYHFTQEVASNHLYSNIHTRQIIFYVTMDVIRIENLFLTNTIKIICFTQDMVLQLIFTIIQIQISSSIDFVELLLSYTIQVLFVIIICIQNNDNNSKIIDEFEFRTKMSYACMHDMRNYLQSSIISMKEIFLSNISILSHLRKDFYQIMETDIYVLENLKHLQTTDLIFNEIQNLKLEEMKTMELQVWINRKLRMFMKNKQWKIQTKITKFTIDEVKIDRHLIKMIMVTIVQQLSESGISLLEIKWSNFNVFYQETDPASQLENNILRIDICSDHINFEKGVLKLIENHLLNKVQEFIKSNTNEISVEILQSKLGIAIILTHHNYTSKEYVKLVNSELLNEHLSFSEHSIFEDQWDENQSIKSNYSFLNITNNTNLKHFDSAGLTSLFISEKSNNSSNQSRLIELLNNMQAKRNENQINVSKQEQLNVLNNKGTISQPDSSPSNNSNNNIKISVSIQTHTNFQNYSPIVFDKSTETIFYIQTIINCEIDKNPSDSQEKVQMQSPNQNKLEILNNTSPILDKSQSLPVKNKPQVKKLSQQLSDNSNPPLNTCFINLDDEDNILRMHSRMFKKANLTLNCCRSGKEFYEMIIQMNTIEWFTNKRVVAIIDYKLVNEYGDEVIEQAKGMIKQYNLKQELVFVALTSTEDLNVINKFKKHNVLEVFQKPLKKSQLEILKQIVDEKMKN